MATLQNIRNHGAILLVVVGVAMLAFILGDFLNSGSSFISHNREYVGVIEGKALPVIEIAPLVGFYDYKNKYQAGSAVETCPAVLTEEQTKQMQHFAEAAYRSVGMQSYARFDFMMDEKTGNMYCLEANTLPGMTPTSLLPQEAAAIGMSYPELCEHIIAVSMKKYEEN